MRPLIDELVIADPVVIGAPIDNHDVSITAAETSGLANTRIVVISPRDGRRNRESGTGPSAEEGLATDYLRAFSASKEDSART